MANPLLGQILGGVFSNVMRGRARPGPFGGSSAGSGLGGVALGGLLGGLVRGRTPGRSGNHGMLLAMLLPLAMQWVQRSGGIGAVLEKFKQKGYGQHAQSWLKPGQPNDPLQADAVDNVVGREELSRIAKQLGVADDDVAHAFAEIIPEVSDQLTPQGEVTPEADEALEAGTSELQKLLREIQPDTHLA